MWAWMVLLCLLAGGARADCDACVAGRCHARRPLLRGSQVSNQLAIDRTDNILYAQLKPDTVTAIFLDEPKQRTLSVAKATQGLAVDQATQILYSSYNGFIYGHKWAQDTYSKNVAFMLDRPTTPAKLRYEDTLYTINEDGSITYYSKTRSAFITYDVLKDYVITDLANVANITNWYYVSDNNLYKFVWEVAKETSQVISNKKHVLSIGRYGDVYFGDASKKIIYRLDRESRNLKEYASYNDGSVEDFVFDRNENIVFHDAVGNVAMWQWMPDGEACVVKK